MKFTYADPPYLGCGRKYLAHHPEAMIWDDPESHRALITRLCDESPDGWAMSLSSPSLRTILPMCPEDVRVASWVKPFCAFKPNVGLAYAWEPIVIRGGRKITRQQRTVRDWVSANITLKRGLTGAKPRDFCNWLFTALNIHVGDDFVDLFPGTGGVMTAWREWSAQLEPVTPRPDRDRASAIPYDNRIGDSLLCGVDHPSSYTATSLSASSR